VLDDHVDVTYMSIMILSTPSLPRFLLNTLQQAISRTFQMSCQHNPLLRIDPQSAYNPKREQYLSHRILTHLRTIANQHLTPDIAVVLGIVDVDLYAPQRNYLYGEAEYPGRFALVSVYRLRPENAGNPPDTSLLARRLVKEAIHEIGHCVGLPHCPDATCVMYFAQQLDDVDHKDAALCPRCHHVHTYRNPVT
jgi:archaemetzincin